MAHAVTPFLMFQGAAERAARLDVSLLAGSTLDRIERYGPGEQGTEGSVERADPTVSGR